MFNSVPRDQNSSILQVMNTETREEMQYRNPPETEFQRYIRSTEYGNSASFEYIICDES